MNHIEYYLRAAIVKISVNAIHRPKQNTALGVALCLRIYAMHHGISKSCQKSGLLLLWNITELKVISICFLQ